MHLGLQRRIHPNKVAFSLASGDDNLTYRELDELSNQTAHLLRNLGLNHKDGIALLLDNELAYLVICWAAQRSGLYFTPISILFQPREVNYIIGNSDAKVVFTNARHLDKIDREALGDTPILLVDGPHDDIPGWRDAIASMPVEEVSDAAEGAEMVYSSGTTGQPKGVRFDLALNPPGHLPAMIERRIELHQVNEATRYLSTAPLYHSAPLRYCMMVSRLGGTAIIMEKFDAQAALELIDQHRITHSQWVPTMFVRLLRLPETVRAQYRLDSHRYAIHAAAPCPVDVKTQMIDWWGPILYEYYSGTEANGSTAINSFEWLDHPGSVGRAFHGEIHILDDAGQELPTGEVGTVYFGNGSDFSYYKDPGKTRAAKTPEGWSTLGDVGYLDQDGYLYLKDRKSFMIISGGVNIYPQEIEDVIISHPAVADVAVFGVPNEEFGEEVKAVVELNDAVAGTSQVSDEIIALCRDRLSHVKTPRSVDFIDKLPRHPTGKLYKQVLREPYWAGHQSHVI